LDGARALIWVVWGYQEPERSVYQVAYTEDDRFLVPLQDSSKAMAMLPWVDTIESLTPSEFSNAKPTPKYVPTCSHSMLPLTDLCPPITGRHTLPINLTYSRRHSSLLLIC
jgi:hypothetical protein